MAFRRYIRSLVVSALAVAAALLVAVIPIAIAGSNPLEAYQALIGGAIGSRNAIAESLVKAVPLILVGLGISISFRARMWNIGAEGQLYIGAIAATGVALEFDGSPMLMTIPLAVAAAAAAGGAWAGIAGVLRVRFGASEIVSTLMLTYVAIQLVSYLVSGPWRDAGATEPFTAEFGSEAHLPILLDGTRLHIGIVFVAFLAIVTFFAMSRMVFGYRIDMVGQSQSSAQYAGLPIRRILTVAIVTSGAIAGSAGAIEVLGLHHRLFEEVSPGYGFTGIAVAMLGRLHPIGVIAAGLLFAGLLVGADSMQQTAGVPFEIVFIVQSLVIVFLLVGERATGAPFFPRRTRPPTGSAEEEASGIPAGGGQPEASVSHATGDQSAHVGTETVGVRATKRGS